LAYNDPLIIIEMTKIETLIRYDSFSDSYRLHHLFKDFFNGWKLIKLTTDEMRTTHLIAAKWYENNNHPLRTINHYKLSTGIMAELFDIILSC